MSLFNRHFRGIGSYVALASGTIFVSYALAIYVDSKKKRLIFKYDKFSISQRNRNIDNSSSPISIIEQKWRRTKESQKTMYALILFNSIIFFAWSLRPTSIFMNRYFLHSITSHPLSMLGSIFSHKSILHLGFNMFALMSFGSFLHDKMGREQFLAFYLSSGMSSSLASHIYKSLRKNYTPSLGASGAIFGLVGGCAHYPELKVSLIFLPIHSVPINQALPLMMGVDSLGILLNWKVFDHAAHLGGSLFGYSFLPISQDKIWKNRSKILRNFNLQ
jgi:rhomboid-like protein